MLNLRSLRYFVTLARRCSYARAAEDLGISQPALTRAIQSLEQQFGARLFDRDRVGVTLTAQGRTLADRAAVLLANADDLERQWQLTARGEGGRVRFGMAPMPARALLPSALGERLEAAPGLANDVVVRNVEALWPLLTAGEIEFFVSAEGQIPDSPPVRADVLGHFPVSLIVRPGHPLLEGRSGETFPVLLSSRSGLPLPPDLDAVASGTVHVIEDFGVLSALTAETDAIWLSSTFAVTNELRAGSLAELPRPPRERPPRERPRESRIMFYTLERRTLSPAVRAIRDALRNALRRIAEARTG